MTPPFVQRHSVPQFPIPWAGPFLASVPRGHLGGQGPGQGLGASGAPLASQLPLHGPLFRACRAPLTTLATSWRVSTTAVSAPTSQALSYAGSALPTLETLAPKGLPVTTLQQKSR